MIILSGKHCSLECMTVRGLTLDLGESHPECDNIFCVGAVLQLEGMATLSISRAHELLLT